MLLDQCRKRLLLVARPYMNSACRAVGRPLTTRSVGPASATTFIPLVSRSEGQVQRRSVRRTADTASGEAVSGHSGTATRATKHRAVRSRGPGSAPLAPRCRGQPGGTDPGGRAGQGLRRHDDPVRRRRRRDLHLPPHPAGRSPAPGWCGPRAQFSATGTWRATRSTNTWCAMSRSAAGWRMSPAWQPTSSEHRFDRPPPGPHGQPSAGGVARRNTLRRTPLMFGLPDRGTCRSNSARVPEAADEPVT